MMVKGNQFWDVQQWGTQAKARETALGAVRSYLRRMNIDPLTIDGEAAYQSLFDLAALDETTIAGRFARLASHNQLDLFVKNWNRWRGENQSGRSLVLAEAKRVADEARQALDEFDAWQDEEEARHNDSRRTLVINRPLVLL